MHTRTACADMGARTGEGYRTDPRNKAEGVYPEGNVGALRVSLTSDDLSRVDAAAPLGVAAGPRYPEAGMKRVSL